MFNPEIGQRFYRFDDVPAGDGTQTIVIRTFRLERVSDSGKTGTIHPLMNAGKYNRPRRISLTSGHPWAHPELEVAWEDFRRRKCNQVGILMDRLRRAEAVFAEVRQTSAPDAIRFVTPKP